MAPPPPPEPPKDLDDGDRVTTEAGSSPLSDEDSSANDEANANDEGSQLPAAEEAAEAEEEEQLAQDREEVEEPTAGALERRSQSPLASTSPDEDDEDSEEASQRGGHEAAWRALAVCAMASISRKIPRAKARLDHHAEALIAAATNPDELAQMYEGWTAWI